MIRVLPWLRRCCIVALSVNFNKSKSTNPQNTWIYSNTENQFPWMVTYWKCEYSESVCHFIIRAYKLISNILFNDNKFKSESLPTFLRKLIDLIFILVTMTALGRRTSIHNHHLQLNLTFETVKNIFQQVFKFNSIYLKASSFSMLC